MITEDYVSFETAKLLKKMGFDEYCPLWYNLDKPIEGPFFYKEIGWYGHNSYDYNGKRIVSAPTLQMAMKWLREVHNLHIMVNCIGKVNYDPIVQRFDGKDFEIEGVEVGTTRCINGKWENVRRGFRTYEQACEAAIKYCLENQGEQKLVKCNTEWYDFVRWFVKERTNNYTLIPSDANIHTWGDIILEHAKKELEKQGEQKPANKVEPKFKVGDWIIYNKNIKLANSLMLVTGKDDNEYLCNYRDGQCSYNIEFIDKEYRLWSIQDAKDGDILFQDLIGGKTFIFDGVNPEMAILYSFIINNDGEDVLPYHIGKPNTGIGNIEENKNIIHPATKEQRNLLFQKMKEAGYEWDAEKKELRKVEQKLIDKIQPKFKVGDIIKNKKNGDTVKVEQILSDSYCYSGWDGAATIHSDFLISDQDNWELVEQKPADNEMIEILRTEYEKGRADAITEFQKEWSEEDERLYRGLHNLIYSTPYCDSRKELSDWLKSLKDRVQLQNGYNPYKEVVESIAEMCKHYDKASHSGLRDFYDNVKVKCKDAKEYESLFPRHVWKPTDEQMKALSAVNVNGRLSYIGQGQELIYLYQDLKKLKGE